MKSCSFKLKIGIHQYHVIHSTHMEESGKVDKERGIIYISKGLMKTEELATLLHEVLHVINNELSHTDTEFLGQAFAQFFADNHNKLQYQYLKKKK